MRPAPAVALVVGYGAGLATGLLRFGDTGSALLGLAVLVLAVGRRPTLVLILGAALVGRGVAWVAWRVEPARCSALLKGGEVRVVGVPRDPPVGATPVRFAPAGRCDGDIAVRWSPRARAEVGTRVAVEGRWIPRPEGPAGRPGGVLVAARVAPALGDVPRGLAARARLFGVTRQLYGSRAPLVDALLFDRRGALDPVLRDTYAQAGLIHLLSISGFHVGLIVAWILILCRAAGLSRERAWLVATAVAVGYVGWLGWPAPATRAVALAVVTCTARLRQRQVAPGSLLAVTALAVLVVDPWAIFDIGAWLSVGSLGGATHFTRWSDRALGRHAGWQTLAGSIGATLATAPITAAALGTVALAGIVLNFIGIPLAAIAVPGALASVVIAPVAMPLARAFAAGAGIGLVGLDRLAALGAILPFGHMTLAAEPMSALPWLLVLGIALWAAGSRNTRGVAGTRIVLAGAAAAWVGLLWTAALSARGPVSGLRLDFLDVGQGDAALLRTPHGHAILIDAGPRLEGRDAGRRVVAPFLAREGIDRLDAVVLSHAHLDHFGGIPAVLDRVNAALLLEPGEAVPDSAYLGMLDAAAADGTQWAPLRSGDTLRVDGVELVVLHPDTTWAEWGLDLNEDSVVLLIHWGAFHALLAGDAGLRAEGRLRGRVGDIDLLKVGHHGSRTASGVEWLAELKPEVAVVSVGRGNRYGHPAAETLGRLRTAGASVWRTDESGTIEVLVDSATMRVHGSGRSEQYALTAATSVHP
ncbi:MAG: DNA internalization-related competence protein ComEC/Rec2 [Gemmatimonadales bacterium]